MAPKGQSKQGPKSNEEPEEIQEERPEDAEKSRVLLEQHGYTVSRTLGSGSYSTVKLVSKKGIAYACKIVSKELTSAVYRAKFLPRELEIIASIRHPHITYVSEIIDMPSKVFIIMELAPGGDLLEKILKVKRFKEKRARWYFLQMSSALAYLHSKDITHRDLKCENVLLTSTNHVKLADFSFARYSAGRQLSATFCGSEAYAPPEVLQGVRYRPKKADVWSLGVILFVAVTGLLPYESECVPRQVRLQMTRTLRFPQVLPLSSELKNLIRGMLEPVATLRSSMARVLRHPWVRELQVPAVRTKDRVRQPKSALDAGVESPSTASHEQDGHSDEISRSLSCDSTRSSLSASPDRSTASRELRRQEAKEDISLLASNLTSPGLSAHGSPDRSPGNVSGEATPNDSRGRDGAGLEGEADNPTQSELSSILREAYYTGAENLEAESDLYASVSRSRFLADEVSTGSAFDSAIEMLNIRPLPQSNIQPKGIMKR
ncbi:testis-specific serine/threonine-protein kinase 6-like [Amblyomma americanum]